MLPPRAAPAAPSQRGGGESALSNHVEEIVTLTAVSGRTGARRAWLPAAGLVLTLGIFIGVGALGRGAAPDGQSGPAEHHTGKASASSASVSPGDDPPVDAPPAIGDGDGGAIGPGRAMLVAVPQAGYQVSNAVDDAHPPVITDGGALATFEFGPRIGGETFDGTIQVSVGTRASGAVVAGRGGPVIVSGATLEDLRTRYLEVAPGRVVTRSARELGGQLSVFIRFDDGAAGMRAVALVVHGERTFVLTATGFGRLFGAVSDAPAEVGLEKFLSGFSFAAEPVVSAPGPLDDAIRLR